MPRRLRTTARGACRDLSVDFRGPASGVRQAGVRCLKTVAVHPGHRFETSFATRVVSGSVQCRDGGSHPPAGRWAGALAGLRAARRALRLGGVARRSQYGWQYRRTPMTAVHLLRCYGAPPAARSRSGFTITRIVRLMLPSLMCARGAAVSEPRHGPRAPADLEQLGGPCASAGRGERRDVADRAC